MRLASVLLASTTVLAACTGGADPPAASTSTEPPSTTITPTTVAPTTSTSLGFEKPATIDVPYVQRVVDVLFHLEGEAARHIHSNRVPDAEFNERLEAIFGEPALEEAKTFYGRGAARGFDNFADPPGDPSVRVKSLVASTPACILVRAALDYRPMFRGASRTEPDGFVRLSPGDVLPLNPTGWGIVGAGRPAPGKEATTC